MREDENRIRVVPINDGETASRRAAPNPWRRLGPLIGLLAGLALVWAPFWGPEATTGSDRVVSVPDEAAETQAAMMAPIEGTTAEDTFRAFVTAVDRGDVDAVLGLMPTEIPDVLGLGTIDHPQLVASQDLWTEGTLDGGGVAGLLRNVSGQPGWLLLSGCNSHADGPEVTIAMCTYSVKGPWVAGGFIEESGQMYGFVVDGKVAGVAHRIEAVATVRPLD